MATAREGIEFTAFGCGAIALEVFLIPELSAVVAALGARRKHRREEEHTSAQYCTWQVLQGKMFEEQHAKRWKQCWRRVRVREAEGMQR